MFCRKCGNTTKEMKSDWNESLYPFMNKCSKCDYKCYRSSKNEQEGIPIRTKTKDGYQTVYLPEKFKHLKDKFWDTNFHSVCLFIGFNK